MPFVVDNSVVVGWHLGNQATTYSDAVLNALAGDTGHVPALWSLEFSNVVRKALVAKKITEERAREMMHSQASTQAGSLVVVKSVQYGAMAATPSKQAPAWNSDRGA